MNYEILKAKLTTGHPGTGAYDADNAIAATQLNVVNRTRDKASLTGSEVLNAVDAAQWALLNAADKQQVWDIVHLGNINPFGVEATMMIDIFGGGTATIVALAAARVEAVSRAMELGLGFVYEGHVQQARAM